MVQQKVDNYYVRHYGFAADPKLTTKHNATICLGLLYC